LKKNINVKFLIYTSVIAAVYTVLTMSTSFVGYGPIQFRIAEVLTLLVFIDKKYIPGLVLGCFLSNLASPLGIMDWILGTLATFLSVYMISKTKNLFLASLWPSIINGLIIGSELYFLGFIPQTSLKIPAFALTTLSVALGEFVVVSIVGYTLFRLLLSKSNIVNILKID
jgi:uncharacterized membrane protein